MVKVLITNTSLCIPHGSETWVQAVALGFRDLGFEVFVYSPKIGKFYSENLEPHGIKAGIPDYPALCIFNHLATVRDQIPQYILDGENNIAMCHGTVPPPEKPVYIPNMRYVCVSDEIRRFYPHIPFEIVGQPISKEWFECEKEIRCPPERIIWASHRHGLPQEIFSLCNKEGISIEHLGANGIASPCEVFRKYQSADLVIGTGRWVYQAIAMGIPAIVADSKISMGYVDELSYETLNEVNMTTRHKTAIDERMSCFLHGFDPYWGVQFRREAIVRHHATAICLKLLKIGIDPSPKCNNWESDA